ncbi:MAG: extracellular solute-binding protein [Clostridium sp.]|nr:extracellular solute-binding protein [Clostridium sp.]
MENWWMKMNNNFKKYIVMIAILSVTLITGMSIIILKKDTVIKVGIFAGSSWDVPYSNSYELIDNTIKKFEEEHPGVKVKYVNGIMKEDYSEYLSEQLLKGNAPDVFMILPEDFNSLANVGAMKDLTTLIKKDKSFDSSKFYKSSFEFGQYYNKQFALPYESVPTMMFVNKTLLEKEGIDIPKNDWSYDDFYNICSEVTKDTDNDGIIDQFGFYDYKWKDAVYANGASLFNDEGTKSYFADKRVQESINFIKRLNSLNKGYSVTSKDFDDGKVAFHPLLFSEYTTYKTYPWKIKKYTGFDWDCIKMPRGEFGGNVSEVTTVLAGINSKTKNEKLSWEFLKTLTYNEDIQKEIFNYSQGVSVLKSVTNSKEVLDRLGENTPSGSFLNMDLLNEVMEGGIVSPRFRKYKSVMDMADTMIDQTIGSSDDNLSYDLLKLQREADNLLKN